MAINAMDRYWSYIFSAIISMFSGPVKLRGYSKMCCVRRLSNLSCVPVSLREAARKENPNLVQWKKCMCQGQCSKNCYCVRNNLKCTSHCHPTKTCRNVEVTHPDINLNDRKLINDEDELTDKHILAAQQLLKKQFPSNNGLRNTVTLSSGSSPEPTPYIQIMHVNGNHWITVAATNQKGPVEVFDSLKPARLSEPSLQAIKKYHGQNCLLKLMNRF